MTVRRRATQREVARLAGVSQATVSVVLAGSSLQSIPRDTFARVLRAAGELGYVPNRFAQGLKTNRTMTLACVVLDIANPFHPSLVRGVQVVADAEDYDVIALNTGAEVERERRIVQWGLQGRVDGIIGVFFTLCGTDFEPPTGDKLIAPDVSGPKWVETMKWYGDLYASGLAPRGITPEQMPDLFANGQLAFFVGGPWNFRAFGAASGLHFGIAPHPYFAGGKPVTPTDSWAVGISPHSKHQAEALKFASVMTLDTKGDLLTTAQNPLPPANGAAFAQHVEQVTKAGGDATAPYGRLLDHELKTTAVSRPRTVGYVLFEEIMNKAFSDVRNGADAKQVLDRSDTQLKTAFGRLR